MRIGSLPAKVCLFFSLFPLLALNIIVMIWRSKISDLLNLDGTTFLQIVENWENQVIQDVVVNDLDVPCFPNQELITYQFPHFTPSCDCGSSGVRNLKQNQNCDPPCIYIGKESDEQEQNNWGDLSKGYRLCAVVSEGISYMKNYPNSDGECRQDFYLCGGGIEGELDYGICVPKSMQKCPYQQLINEDLFNQIMKNKTDDDIEILNANSSNLNLYESIPGTKLYGTRNLVNVNPIGNIIVHQGPVCLDNIHSIFSTGKSQYPTNQGCQIIQKTFTPADYLPVKSFFEYNQLHQLSEAQSLTQTNNGQDINITLWTRPNLLWKSECRQNGKFEFIIILAQQVRLLQNTCLFVLVIDALLLSYFFFLILMVWNQCGTIFNEAKDRLLHCYFWAQQQEENQISDYCRLLGPYTFLLILLHWMLVLTQFVGLNLETNQTQDLQNQFKKMNIYDCSNPQINSFFQYLAEESIGQILSLIYFNYIIMMSLLILETFTLVLLWVCIISKRREAFKQAKQLGINLSNISTLDERNIQENIQSKTFFFNGITYNLNPNLNNIELPVIQKPKIFYPGENETTDEIKL